VKFKLVDSSGGHFVSSSESGERRKFHFKGDFDGSSVISILITSKTSPSPGLRSELIAIPLETY